MPSIKELKAELFLLRQTWKILPVDSFEEETRRECMEKIILVQIDAEEFRNGFRSAFVMTKIEHTEIDVDGKKIKTVQTAFNWEPLRDRFFRMVDKKESERIAHYKNEIKKTYTTEQEPASPTASKPQPQSA